MWCSVCSAPWASVLLSADDFPTPAFLKQAAPAVELAGPFFHLPTKQWDGFPFATAEAGSPTEQAARRELVNARRLLRNANASRTSSVASAFDAHLLLGDHFVREANCDEAMRHYREALLLKPKDVEARVSLAQCLGLAGQPEAALEVWQGVAQDSDDSAWLAETWRYIARLKQRLGHPDVAAARKMSIRYHRQRLRQQPLTVSERLRLSVGLSQALKELASLDSVKEARAVLSEAIDLCAASQTSERLEPTPKLQHAFLLAERARVFRRLAEMGEANSAQCLERAETDLHRALRLSRDVADSAGRVASVRTERLLMRVLIERGKSVEAIRVGRNTVKQFEDLIEGGNPELAADLAGTWLQLARTLDVTGQREPSLDAYRQAQKWYEQALRLNDRPDLTELIEEVNTALRLGT